LAIGVTEAAEIVEEVKAAETLQDSTGIDFLIDEI